MTQLIVILTTIIGMLCLKLYKVIIQRDINYSNYKNCLLALKEHDPKLSAYMEAREKNERD